jgi:hypothetical protein
MTFSSSLGSQTRFPFNQARNNKSKNCRTDSQPLIVRRCWPLSSFVHVYHAIHANACIHPIDDPPWRFKAARFHYVCLQSQATRPSTPWIDGRCRPSWVSDFYKKACLCDEQFLLAAVCCVTFTLLHLISSRQRLFVSTTTTRGDLARFQRSVACGSLSWTIDLVDDGPAATGCKFRAVPF